MNSASEETQINKLRLKIPPAILGSFDRFLVRGKKAISSVRKGVCSECHMKLTIGLVVTLMKRESIERCPNCGRFLHLSEDEVPAHPVAAPVSKPKATRKKSGLTQEAHVA
ncbi:MAG: C4-type zinc ribbon domain-containing protein [Verrucomicrobiota bacterium]